jgi:hypothetical protein
VDIDTRGSPVPTHARNSTTTAATAFVVVLSLLLTLLVGVGPARAAGTLSGTVTGDGAGLADVLIELQPPGGGVAVETTTTGATGRYSLTAAAGTYDVVATPPADSLFSSATVSDVTVTDETTETVDIQLVLVDDGGGGPVPPVTGTVVVGGAPFAGAVVAVQESAGFGGVQTTTAGDGSFALTPTGEQGLLTVSAVAGCGDTSLPAQMFLRSFYDTDVTTDYPVDLVVAPLTVLVLDPDGVEVPGAIVELAGNGRPPVEPAPLGGEVSARTECGRTTGADGRVTQATAVGITTSVIVRASGYAALSLDVTVEGLAGQEIIAPLQPPPVPVTGVVLGVDGTPRPGVTVEVFVTSEQPAERIVSGADGSFRLTLVPGTRRLRLSADGLGTAAEGGPAAPFEATVGIDVPAEGVDLGTWRVPLAAVDLDVVLEGTGDLLRSRVNPTTERADVQVFGRDGEISNAGRFQGILTESASEPASAPLYLVPGEMHTLAFLNNTVPDGYARPDPNWTITGPAAYSRTSATRVLPLSGGDGLLVGRVVQDGVGVPRVVVADVRGEFVRTDTDGRFELPIATGERDIAVNVGSEANAPGFANARLNNLQVLPGTTDLGDLALPYVSWDVRVAVPAGEEPIEVDLETTITTQGIDAGWGIMSFTGGYPVGGGLDEDVRVTADGRANRLWMVPSRRSVRLDVTPVGSTGYAPATSFPTVAGPSTLLVQLQRLADPDPVDLPPTISGLASRSIGESAPNVQLSVAAADPEGEAVTVSWDVLGIAPAPTGTSVELGPLDGPQDFDAVATACDPAGNCASFTIAVEIRDEPPTLTASLPSSAEVGEDVVLTASATDPRDDVTVDVDWGDSSAVEPVVDGSAVHAWSAPGTYLVTVRAVTDDATVSEQFSIDVVPATSDPEDDDGDDDEGDDQGGDDQGDDDGDDDQGDDQGDDDQGDDDGDDDQGEDQGDDDQGDDDQGRSGPPVTRGPPLRVALAAGPVCEVGIPAVEFLVEIVAGSLPATGLPVRLVTDDGALAEFLVDGPTLDRVQVADGAGTSVTVTASPADPVTVVLEDCTDVAGVELEPDQPSPVPSPSPTAELVVDEPVAAAPDVVDVADLPATGGDVGGWTSLAVGLLALGMLVLGLTGPRRRRG